MNMTEIAIPELAQRVYLVMGSTGEYSDRTEWCVAVYTNREQAELHAKLAYEHLKQFCEARGIGVKYSVEELPLMRHVDEYLEAGIGRREIVRK